MFAFVSPAAAQQGGTGGHGEFGSGGNGGDAGQPGDPASCGPLVGGTFPECSHPGGPAGTSPGGNGGDAGNQFFNPTGGGGGGADGSAAAPIGGNGGNGGNSTDLGNYTSGGGGGGGGGNGVIVSGSFSNPGQVRGGRGGNGGTASPGRFDVGGGGGGGGEGGAGIIAGPGSTINNGPAFSITGGDGGVGGRGDGNSGPDGAHGAAGVGIRGSDLSIVNAGSISGGLGGDGVTRAFAVHLTGGANSLELQGGASITGDIQIDTGDLTFVVSSGIETLASAITGAGSIIKSGAGTLILTGTNTYTGTTTIRPGTLQIGDGGTAGTLAAGNVMFDDVQAGFFDGPDAFLAFNRSDAVTLSNTISGFGGLRQDGSGTLLITGANSFTGTTTINSGTLQLDDLGGLGSSRVELNAGTVLVNTNGSLANNLYWNAGAEGTVSAGQNITLTLTGSINFFGEDTTVQFGEAGDTGVIVSALSGGSNDGSARQTLRIGGGTFRAGGVGTTNLLIGNFETVQIDAGATLDLNATQASTNLHNLTGSGTLLNGNGTSVVFDGDFDGTIGGDQTILKLGNGTLILGGANTYTGITSIGGGTVQIDNIAALSTNSVILTGGNLVSTVSGTINNAFGSSSLTAGTLAVATGQTLTLGGFVSIGQDSVLRIGNAGNAGTVEFAPTGLGVVGSAQLYVDAGTLRAANAYLSEVTSTVARTEIAAGATLDFAGNVDINGRGGRILNLQGAGRLLNNGENTYVLEGTFAGQIEGGQSITKLGAGTLILTGTNSYSGTTTINGGTLQIGDGTTFGSLGTGNIANNGVLTFWGGDLQTLTVAADISGSGALNVLGGTLVLAGNNSFSGGLTVDEGTLRLGSSNAAGGAGNMITTTGSVIDYADGIDNATPITIASDTTQLQVLVGQANQSGAIGEDQAGRGFEKLGAGTLVLTASNGYSGTTLVSGGLINFATDDNLGTGTITLDGGGLQWASGTSLDISGRLNPIGGNGGTFDTNGNDVALAGALTGTGGITKTGAGTLFLDGSNSYAGTTTVSAGTLGLAFDDSASGGAIFLGDGTTLLNASCSCDGLNLTNDIEIALGGAATIDTDGFETVLAGTISGGDVTFADTFGGGLFVLTGTNTYGATTIDAGATVQVGDGGASGTLGVGGVANEGSLIFNRLDEFTVANAIGGNGSLTQSGTGTLVLTGANSYGGGTTVTAGLINFSDDGNFGTGNIVLDGGGLQWATGSVFDISGRLASFGAGGGTFDTNGNDVSFAGGLSGPGGLTKTGQGTLVLTADNTYDGNTTVSGGVLQVGNGGTSGTLGAGAVSIFGGGTLDINRSNDLTLGDLTIFGGTLAHSGSGTSTFQGNNFVQGAIRLDAGTLAFDNPLTFDEGSLITFNGGSLHFGASQTLDGLVALRWTDGQADSVLTVASGETLAVYSSIELENLGSGNPTLRFGSASEGGTIVLNSAVLFSPGDTGGVSVEGGVLATEYDNDVLNQLVSGLGFVDIGFDGVLDLSGGAEFTATEAIRSLTGSGVLSNDSTTRILAGNFSGTVDGAGGIDKTGSGTLTLNGFNTYTGNTSILDGTLAIGIFALGSSQLTEIGNGARLQALEDAYAGDMRILASGGTIDTGAFTLEVLGAVDFQGLLTKTGVGTLILTDIFEEGDGDGGIDVLAGTLGLGSDYAAGTGRIWLADGTTLLNASCFCGDLTLDNDIQVELGGVATIDAAGQSLAFGSPTTVTLNGDISGGDVRFISPDYVEGGIGIAQPAVFVLNGTNSYGRSLIAPNIALILQDGTLGTGDVEFDSGLSDPLSPAALVFANSADYAYGGAIVGEGLVVVQTFDPETTVTLSGSNTAANNFTGTVEVDNGRLAIDGNFGDVVGNTAELFVGGCGCGLPSLGGSGTFYGNVELTDAALAPGNSPGTLNIAGNLTLGAGTILNFELGEPGAVGGPDNDFVTVGGNLTLDGTLNTIAWNAGYGPGYYRLFNYGGTLTDNTLDAGAIAGGLSAGVLTNIAGQVNVLLGPQVLQYWDGIDTTGSSTAATGNGGSGTWNAAGTNWTAATGFGINDQWRASVGAFAGAAGGTVTVDGAHAFQELRFATDGYLLRPADINARLQTSGGFSIVDVATGLLADIGVIVQGAAGLTKTGDGTLLLSAVNSYTGATEVTGGTLRIGIDGSINNQSALVVAAGATFDLDGFETQVGSLAGAGAVTLDGGRLNIGFDNSSTTFGGTVAGEGVVTKNGTGTLTLSGAIELAPSPALDYFIQVNGGTLEITATGSLAADLIQNFSTMTNAGTIAAGTILQSFGTLTNTGTILGTTQNFATLDNSGGTMGALQSLAGTATNSGTINGEVQTFASFTSTGIINGTLSNFATALVENQLNGQLLNLQTGATVTLTGTTTGITNYTGATGSLLDLANFSTTVGALSGTGGTIEIGTATLTIDSLMDFANFDGVISGSGPVIKTGSGEQVLRGVNTYTGLTTVSGGTLAMSDTGSLVGDVQNDATFANAGTVNGALTNTGTASNTGTIAGGVDNTGTFSSSGTIAFGVDNAVGAEFNVQGVINGFVANRGTVNLTSALTGVGIFLQSGTGQTNLNGFDLTAEALQGDGGIDLGLGSATLTTGDATDVSFFGEITGSGNLTKTGTGELTLAGTNTYAGTTTISGGTLRVSIAGSLGTGDIVDNGALILEQNGPVTLGGMITGSGSITKTGTGSLELTGVNTAGNDFTGAVQVSAGSLILNGVFGDTTGNLAQLTMDAGTLLGGSGAFLGSATVNGTLAAGNSPGTMTIGGDLALGLGTILNFELGEAGVAGGSNNDLVVVGGNLTLDGTLNAIASGPGYGPGYYRLFGYGGTLTDNGLAIGTIEGGLAARLLTNIAGQVNLALGPQLIQYWDGTDLTGASTAVTGDGGVGTWTGSDTNWTTPTGFGINDAWQSSIGVFAGAAGGAVTVVGTQNFQELRFETDGYVLTGATAVDGLGTTGGFSVIDVADGLGAEIAAQISGAAGLTKTGDGALTLSGFNSYTGLTTISEGVLQLTVSGVLSSDVRNDATLTTEGVVIGDLLNNGTVTAGGGINGSIVNNGDISLSGALNGVQDFTQAAGGSLTLSGVDLSIATLAGTGTIDLGGGNLGTSNATDAQFDGEIFGPGDLLKAGIGTLTLSGNSTAGFIIFEGELVLTGSTTLDVVNSATFTNQGTVGGVVLNHVGGTAVNDGSAGSVNNYGAFTSSGSVENGVVNQGGATLLSTGTLAGEIFNATGGLLTSTGTINGLLDNYGSASIAGQLNGEVVNVGDIVLTGTTVGIGGVNQRLGNALFDLNGFDTSFGSLTGDGEVRLGTALLTVGGDNTSRQFDGVITGTGGVTKIGTGSLWLSGANTFIGLTTISDGFVALRTNATLAGAVRNDAEFENEGTVAGLLTNTAEARNEGTLNGGVVNSGILDTLGTINGNLTNSGSVFAEGAINGAIVNDSYVTLTGSLTGVTGFTQGVDGTLILRGETFSVGALDGAGYVELGGGLLEVGAGGADSQFDGEIYDTGALTKVGAGTLTLGGINTYVGTTTISDGTLRVGADGSLGYGDIVVNAALILEQSADVTIDGLVTGGGSIVKTGAGSLELTSSNTPGSDFTGTFQVSNGSLVLNGAFGDATGNTTELTMDAGTSLGGSGTFLGSATVNGTLAAGNSPGTLTIAGNLTLGAAAILDYELGESGTAGGANNDLVVVGGNLTLDGTLNTVAFGAGYGAGYYRLFDYGGTLTDNGLSIGTIAGGLSANVLTNIAGQVNVVLGPQVVQYWDDGDLTGASSAANGDGGSGTWNASNTNWTAAAGFGINDQWRGSIGVFAGAAGGTVAIEGTQSFQELRFATDGYVLAGSTAADGLATTGGFSVIDVADGAGADISAQITGAGGLTKTGLGTLTLGGVNTYAGTTTVSAGTLVVSATGSLAGGVVNNATLISTGTLNGGLVNSGDASIGGDLNGSVANSGALALIGSTAGIGAVTQTATGAFVLNGFDTVIGSLAGAGTVDLVDATLTLGGDNSSTEFAGEILGSGGLTKTGLGTLTLSGENAFTGNTEITGGTLAIGATGSLASALVSTAAGTTLVNAGTISGEVENVGTLVSTGIIGNALSNSGTASLAGELDGSLDNLGTVTLTGTLTGVATVFQHATGVLDLAGFDTSIRRLSGDGQVRLGSATLTLTGDGGAPVFAGVISGSGGVTKAGNDTLVLTGNQTYTGLTTVSGGVLVNSGTLAGPVLNQATFVSDSVLNGSLTNSGTADISGQLNGAIANSGALNLVGATTGIGAVTQTASGIFTLDDDTTIGSLAGAGEVRLGSATLTLNGGNSSTEFGGLVSGSGNLVKAGTGTLTLSGANTYTGTTTIAGVLQLGNGGAGGAFASSTVANGGVLAINRSDLLEISAAISGSGGLVQAGSGTTQLTGANSYTGGTLVSAGRLVGNTTSLQGAIEANATLEFAQATNGVYAGSLSGTGAFEKTAAGLLNLTGDSSAFTGATRVLGGQLAVNGLLGNSVVTVGAGATLLGLGPIGGLVAQAGSTVAAGNSIGTLTVNGNVQLLPGSTYQAEVTSAAADLIDASGTAQIAGTIAVTNLGGTYMLGTSYVLLDATQGVSGTFDAATGLNSFGPRFRGRIVYTSTQVQLLIAANLLTNIACTAPTRNQASFMAGFDDAVQNGGYDPQALNVLYDLDPAGVCDAVDQLSGGIYPAVASAALEEERLIREAVVDRLRFVQDGEATGTGAWGQLVGAWGHTNADGNGFDVDENREGAIFGIDTGSATWRIGVFGHHLETEVGADALASEARIERTGAGAYAGFANGPFRIRIGASYSDLAFTASRTIAFPGFSGATQGRGDGSMIQGFGELAYRFDLGEETFLEPFADLALATVDLDAIDETGTAVAQLRVDEQEHDVKRAIAGLRGDATVHRGSTRLRLGIDAGLQHNFGDRSIAASIALDDAPLHPFAVRAADIPEWAFVGGGRVAFDFGDNVTATLSYRGVLAGNRNDHAASGTLSVRF